MVNYARRTRRSASPLVSIMDAIISFDFDGRIPHLGRPLARPRRPRQRVRSVLHDPVELPRLHRCRRADVRRCTDGRRVRPQQRRRHLGRHRGRQAHVPRRRVRQPQPRIEPAVLGARAVGAVGSGARLLGQLQLLRRQGPAVDRRRRPVPEQRLRCGTRTGPRSTSTCSSKRSSAAARSSPARSRTTTTTSTTAASATTCTCSRAYATPPIGVGNIQPMVRYQWAKIKGNTRDQSLEHRRRAFLPDQGPGAPRYWPPTATPRLPGDLPETPPTPCSSARRRSFSKLDPPNTKET